MSELSCRMGSCGLSDGLLGKTKQAPSSGRKIDLVGPGDRNWVYVSICGRRGRHSCQGGQAGVHFDCGNNRASSHGLDSVMGGLGSIREWWGGFIRGGASVGEQWWATGWH